MTRSGRVLAVLGLVALAVTGGGAAAGTVQRAALEFEADRLQEIDALLTGQSEEVSA